MEVGPLHGWWVWSAGNLMCTQAQGLQTKARERVSTYLFFWPLGESFFSPSTTFLFRGSGLCTKVHSCLWNSQSTQSTAPSWITQRLFLRRQASQGRSLLVRIFAADPTVDDTGLPTIWFSLPGEGLCCFLGRAAAMGTGVGRGMAGCIATAVVISLAVGLSLDVYAIRVQGVRSWCGEQYAARLVHGQTAAEDRG